MEPWLTALMKRPLHKRRAFHVRVYRDTLSRMKDIFTTDYRVVIVMAVSEGYAMVRQPRRNPYIVKVSFLEACG